MRSGLRRMLRNQASAPVPYAPKGRYQPSLMGLMGLGPAAETYQRAFGTVGTVHSIVTLLARSSARADWKLYRDQPVDGRVRYTTRDAGSDQRTEVVQHQALKVWNQPNDYMSRHDLVFMSQQWLELTGEAYWLIVKAATIPVAIWPVNPARMTPVPGEKKFLNGWLYSTPDGQQIPLGADEVIQLKYPNPLDIYRGLGPVQSVLTDIDASRYSAEWNRSYFLNSAEPNGVITVPTNWTDEEWNEFSDRWRESHQGVSRAHKIAVLEAGAQWQATHTSQRDMDFVNLRNVSRDVIREAWGVHKVMIGVSDDVNRANAQTGEEVHAQWQVMPRLDLIKNVLNKAYLRMFGSTGQGVEFDYSGVGAENREQDVAELMAKAQATLWLAQAGYDQTAVLQAVGLPDMGIAGPPNGRGDAQTKTLPGDSGRDENGKFAAGEAGAGASQDATNRMWTALLNLERGALR